MADPQAVRTDGSRQAPRPSVTEEGTSYRCRLCCCHSPSSSTRFKKLSPQTNRCVCHERRPADADECQLRAFNLLPRQPCRKRSTCEHSPVGHSTSVFEGVDAAPAHFHGRIPASTFSSAPKFTCRAEEKNGIAELPSLKRCLSCFLQSNQVTLYGWYLLRFDRSKVSVGGFVGAAGIERLETAPIVQRLEKCKLLAQDGIEVRLAGLIDDSMTISNGFSVNLAQAFLSGFPYTWNHLLRDELHFPKIDCRDHQDQGDCGLGLGDVSFQSFFEGCHSDQEMNTPLSTCKEASSCHKETCNDIEPPLKIGVTEEPQAERERQNTCTLYASKNNEDIVDDGTVQDAQNDIFNGRRNMEEANTPVGQSKNSATKNLNVLPCKESRLPDAHYTDCQPLKKASTATLSQPSVKNCFSHQDREAGFLLHNDASFCRSEKHKEIKESANEGVMEESQAEKERQTFITQDLSQDKETSALQIVEDAQFNNFNIFTEVEHGVLETLAERLQTKDPGDQKESRVQRNDKKLAFSYSVREQEVSALISAGVGNDADKSLVSQRKQSPCTRQSKQKRHKDNVNVQNSSHSDDFNANLLCPTINKNVPQKLSMPSAESKPCSLSSLQSREIVGERRQSARLLSKKSNKGELCAANFMNRSASQYSAEMETSADVDLQRSARLLNTDTNLNSKEREFVQEEIVDTKAPPGNTDVAKGVMEAIPNFDIEAEKMAPSPPKKGLKSFQRSQECKQDKCTSRTRHSKQCSKRPMMPPALPCPRVLIAKELVSTAFGLKISRSGRLLVPPLAHWCGQSLLRDKDGGIIAISDGSKDLSSKSSESSKFKPPAGQHLQRLQKRLCKVAKDYMPLKKRYINKKKPR